MALDNYMNKSYGAMMEGAKEEPGEKPAHGKKHAGGHGHHPQIHIHTHGGGHTVHAFHHDGSHTSQDFALGDHQGVADHVQSLLSGEGAEPEGHEAGAMGAESALPGER